MQINKAYWEYSLVRIAPAIRIDTKYCIDDMVQPTILPWYYKFAFNIILVLYDALYIGNMAKDLSLDMEGVVSRICVSLCE